MIKITPEFAQHAEEVIALLKAGLTGELISFEGKACSVTCAPTLSQEEVNHIAKNFDSSFLQSALSSTSKLVLETGFFFSDKYKFKQLHHQYKLLIYLKDKTCQPLHIQIQSNPANLNRIHQSNGLSPNERHTLLEELADEHEESTNCTVS